MADAVLSTRRLTVASRRGGTILRAVDLDVAAGRVTALVGPSGAGKSTLLRCLNRLIDLTPVLEVSGRVSFHDRDVREPGADPDELRRRVGMVFQQPVVFPGSIRRNILFGANRLGLVRRVDEDALVERCLDAAGLRAEVAERLDEPAATLSIGQRQRLTIARCLAVGPEVLLLDEPTSALDGRSTAAIEATIRELKGTVTVVLVTHDLAQARRLADGAARLERRDGAGQLVAAGAAGAVLDGRV